MARPNVRYDWQAIAAHLDKARDTEQLAKLTGYPIDRVRKSLWWAVSQGLVSETMQFRRGTAVQLWTRTGKPTRKPKPKPKPTRKRAKPR
jgi:hypothetical protein